MEPKPGSRALDPAVNPAVAALLDHIARQLAREYLEMTGDLSKSDDTDEGGDIRAL